MKRNIDFEMDTEDLREKLDMLWLKVQEREARIESEIAALLAKSMSSKRSEDRIGDYRSVS